MYKKIKPFGDALTFGYVSYLGFGNIYLSAAIGVLTFYFTYVEENKK